MDLLNDEDRADPWDPRSIWIVLLFATFIAAVSIGVGLIHGPGLGLVALGITSGTVGFLISISE